MMTQPGMATRFLFVFALLVFLFPSRSLSQGYELWNPGDAYRPWATAVNPALLADHETQIAFGFKVYHLGFLPSSALGIRENRVSFSAPYYLPYDVAAGAELRYFTAGPYYEFAANALLARPLMRGIVVGLKAGLEVRGFQQSRFEGVEAGDPVLEQATAVTNLNLGGGLFWRHGPFQIGMGVDHANRPNIGVRETAVFPREISIAAGYRYGPVMPTLLIRDDGVRWRMGFILAAARPSLGSLRLGYEAGLAVKLEAQLNLDRDSRLDYAVDLPREGTRGASAGTQELVYTRILGREPELDEPAILFTVNELTILQETVIRSMSPGLGEDVLARSPELLSQYLAPEAADMPTLSLVAGRLDEYETDSLRLARWRRLGRQIRDFLQTYPDGQALILANSSSSADAQAINRAAMQLGADAGRIRVARFEADRGEPDLRGFRPGRVSIQTKPLRLSAQAVAIELRATSRRRKTRTWTLSIRDASGQTIRRFSGSGNLPTQITWDWRDDAGRLVAPGDYVCNLLVHTPRGRTYDVDSLPLRVIRIDRKVYLRFQNENEFKTSQKSQDTFSIGEL